VVIFLSDTATSDNRTATHTHSFSFRITRFTWGQR